MKKFKNGFIMGVVASAALMVSGLNSFADMVPYWGLIKIERGSEKKPTEEEIKTDKEIKENLGVSVDGTVTMGKTGRFQIGKVDTKKDLKFKIVYKKVDGTNYDIPGSGEDVFADDGVESEGGLEIGAREIPISPTKKINFKNITLRRHLNYDEKKKDQISEAALVITVTL